MTLRPDVRWVRELRTPPPPQGREATSSATLRARPAYPAAPSRTGAEHRANRIHGAFESKCAALLFGATESASNVSRDGPRLPRPIHPSARISRIAGQLCANAYANVESPVAKYPMIPVGLRSLGRSAIHPPANFAKLERPSETPSITPSANAGAPKASEKRRQNRGGSFVAPIGE